MKKNNSFLERILALYTLDQKKQSEYIKISSTNKGLKKCYYSIPQIDLWLIEYWFSASTFVLKLVTVTNRKPFAVRQ